ncbi:MAG: hypothetical protein ACE37D_17955 [Pseudomonadales bacterium]
MVNQAWIYLAPTLIIMTISAVIPLCIVINYSVQDSFAGDQFYWVGLHWFEDIMRSPDFWASLARTTMFSLTVIALQFGIGISLPETLLQTQKSWVFHRPFQCPDVNAVDRCRLLLALDA